MPVSRVPIVPLMAHRDGRCFDGQRSLSGHCGRGPIFIAQPSVANDPKRPKPEAQPSLRTHQGRAAGSLTNRRRTPCLVPSRLALRALHRAPDRGLLRPVLTHARRLRQARQNNAEINDTTTGFHCRALPRQRGSSKPAGLNGPGQPSRMARIASGERFELLAPWLIPPASKC